MSDEEWGSPETMSDADPLRLAFEPTDSAALPEATRQRVHERLVTSLAVLGLASATTTAEAATSAGSATTAGLGTWLGVVAAMGLSAAGIAFLSGEPLPTPPPEMPQTGSLELPSHPTLPPAPPAAPAATLEARDLPTRSAEPAARHEAVPAANSKASLAEETRLLRSAQALRQSDPKGAAAVLDEYARRFPQGKLNSEADQLRSLLERDSHHDKGAAP